MDGLIKITNTGPETLIIAHYMKGPVHEVFYPRVILQPGEFHEYVMNGPNDILMVSKVALDPNVSTMINTAVQLGMSNTSLDVSLDDPTQTLTWDSGRLVVGLVPAAMEAATVNIEAAQAVVDNNTAPPVVVVATPTTIPVIDAPAPPLPIPDTSNTTGSLF